MKILITGNMGYIGPVVSKHLFKTIPGAYIIGYDAGYFGHCLTGASSIPERFVNEQLFGDVRYLSDELLSKVDAVVELAAISNDPMGQRFEEVTNDINYVSAVSIATRAVKAGVKAVVFASSCSMYGSSEGNPKKETDPINPLTAYARSKASVEKALETMEANGNCKITSLRFATACGWSDRTRLDLVLNDFVACATATKEITVLSDGSPWRPLIELRDMARAIEWALKRETKEDYIAVNVGSDEWNYQVKDLAQAVASAIPGTKVTINKDAPPDKRSYRVDFSLFKRLAPNHQPEISLIQAIEDLKRGFAKTGFTDANFRNSTAMRLQVLSEHIQESRLDDKLNWI
jgi:nucleoside-diphosphate-sugar epimerase